MSANKSTAFILTVCLCSLCYASAPRGRSFHAASRSSVSEFKYSKSASTEPCIVLQITLVWRSSITSTSMLDRTSRRLRSCDNSRRYELETVLCLVIWIVYQFCRKSQAYHLSTILNYCRASWTLYRKPCRRC